MTDYLYEFPNATLTGGDQFLAQLVAQIPILPVIFLMGLYFIITLSGSLAQSYKRGYVDIALWSLFGLLSVDLVALLMSLGDGLISGLVLGFCLGLTILNGLWLYLTMGRYEQV
jgi:hypothetical protein